MSLQMLLSDAAPFRRDEGRGVARKTFAPRRTWPEAEAHPLPVEVGDGRQPAQDGRSCVPDWPGRRRGPSCVSSPRRPARPDGSRPINCATPTRSNSRARASRSTSSSSRSDTPTSAPPRHTSRHRPERDRRHGPLSQTTHHVGHRRTRALATTRGNEIKELRRPPGKRAGRSDWLVLAPRRGWMGQSAAVSLVPAKLRP